MASVVWFFFAISSLHENIFSVTGPVWVHHFPLQRASNTELWWIFMLNKLLNSRVAGDLRRHDAHVTSLTTALTSALKPPYRRASSETKTTCNSFEVVRRPVGYPGQRLPHALEKWVVVVDSIIQVKCGPRPRFTNGFSIAIQIRWKFRFTLTSILIQWLPQLCCRGMCKKLLWSDRQQWNYGNAKFPSNLNCGKNTVSETGPCSLGLSIISFQATAYAI